MCMMYNIVKQNRFSRHIELYLYNDKLNQPSTGFFICVEAYIYVPQSIYILNSHS